MYDRLDMLIIVSVAVSLTIILTSMIFSHRHENEK